VPQRGTGHFDLPSCTLNLRNSLGYELAVSGPVRPEGVTAKRTANSRPPSPTPYRDITQPGFRVQGRAK
jgi:hypothetical protein